MFVSLQFVTPDKLCLLCFSRDGQAARHVLCEKIGPLYKTLLNIRFIDFYQIKQGYSYHKCSLLLTIIVVDNVLNIKNVLVPFKLYFVYKVVQLIHLFKVNGKVCFMYHSFSICLLWWPILD